MRSLVRASWLCALCFGSGCAFPIFHTESAERREGPRAYAYAPHGQHPARREHASPPRDSYARPSEARQRPRRNGSVLAPPSSENLGDPPAPDGTPESCYEALHHAGVAFTRIDDADGVAMPVRLDGPVHGVTFAPADRSETHSILDCRLALSLLDWAQDLRAHGVIRVEHYSMYRPGAQVAGEGKPSGHAFGLAIDAARFTLEDGTLLDVLADWEGRERRGKPCPMRPDEAFGSRVLRTLTCDAVARNLFQVVITPHHDRAHRNHVHLEIKPDVDWTYVR